MAEADWTVLTNSLAAGSVKRGVTGGITRPNGGGNFLYGFNSLDSSQGVVGLFTNQVNFAPMAKGGSVRAAIKRGIGGGKTNFAPFIFICLGGALVTDQGYMLGLGDSDPHRIILRKGALTGGLPDAAVTSPPTSGVLRKSTATYSEDTWLHLRLDAVVNTNGDVVLNVYRNDLAANSVASPVWAAIDGMAQFIDDALGVNSGSAPFTSGRGGFGFQTKDVTRRSYFDHLEILRQT